MLPAILVAFVFWFGTFLPSSAQNANIYDDQQTPEGWAWARIKNGEVADFNELCNTSHLNPNDETERHWDDACRKLKPNFIVDLLTRSPWRDQVPFSGVNIMGARVEGDIDLRNANWKPALIIESARIEGQIVLERSHSEGVIGFRGVRVTGKVDAGGMRAEQWVYFDDNKERTDQSKDRNGPNVNRTDESNDFPYDDQSQFKEEIRLAGAHLRAGLSFDGSIFLGKVDLQRLHTGGSVFARTAEFNEPLMMEFAVVDANVDLSRSHFSANVDLSNATIGQLSLKEPMWFDPSGKLLLRNTHVGILVDTKDAWPPAGRLSLGGFTFDHLGGFGGETAQQERQRGMKWWDQWVRLDEDYSPEPYARLATVMSNAGDREAANEIRFLGRERQREASWQRKHYASWALDTALSKLAGYGIGTYTFRVLYWILGATIVSAILLWLFVPVARSRRRGILWCLGASLARLLPVIEINKEFTVFFDDPDRKHLNGWLFFYFSFLAVFGWVLGGFLVLAVSGLTQTP
jgi:hypothetical protein